MLLEQSGAANSGHTDTWLDSPGTTPSIRLSRLEAALDGGGPWDDPRLGQVARDLTWIADLPGGSPSGTLVVGIGELDAVMLPPRR